MRRIGRFLLMVWVIPLLVQGYAHAASYSGDGREGGVFVGRISFVEGNLLRYIPEEKDWVRTVRDAPFGLDDALYSGDRSRAEFTMPNQTMVRIGDNTQIQMIALREDVTEIDVASGVARFYNNGPQGLIRATTPFGYVVAGGDTVFDLYVGDESVEVISLKGRVDFVHEGGDGRYEVKAGAMSLIADSRKVAFGDGTVDRDWDNWNEDRDRLRLSRANAHGDSIRYLPQGLHEHAYDLDGYGSWQRVYYDGGYHRMWRPTRIPPDWAPYSVGRWVIYHGDPCWVPYEPFGYVTHHFGNWVYLERGWFWIPPPPPPPPRAPFVPPMGIAFSWFPGRVAWIYSAGHIGWFPLAPREVYYGHRSWGPRALAIPPMDPRGVNLNINEFRYIDRAVVVPRSDFFGVRDYRSVRVHNIDRTTILNSYRPAPVVSEVIIPDWNRDRKRFDVDPTVLDRKPHQSVLTRIEHNRRMARENPNAEAIRIEHNVDRTRLKTPEQMGAVPQPRAAGKLVGVDAVGKPVSEIAIERREFKRERRVPSELSRPTGNDLNGRPPPIPDRGPTADADRPLPDGRQTGRVKDLGRPQPPRTGREFRVREDQKLAEPPPTQSGPGQGIPREPRRQRESLDAPTFREGAPAPGDVRERVRKPKPPGGQVDFQGERTQGGRPEDGGQGPTAPQRQFRRTAPVDGAGGAGRSPEGFPHRAKERPSDPLQRRGAGEVEPTILNPQQENRGRFPGGPERRLEMPRQNVDRSGESTRDGKQRRERPQQERPQPPVDHSLDGKGS